MLTCLLLASALAAADMESDVRADETLLLYPTSAAASDDGRTWQVPVHGIVYQPAGGGLVDQAALALFRRFTGISEADAATETFKTRAKAFLVDNERGRDIYVRLGDKKYTAGRSTPNGHFSATISLSADEAAKLRRESADREGCVALTALLPAEQKRTLTGPVQFLDATGISVVSDLDDTIKISEVGDRTALITNTFVKPYEAVPGMAAAYARWRERGASFHYLTASPWQLYVPLEEFRQKAGFPAGDWSMKTFRWKDSTVLDLFGSQVEYKTRAIEPLLTRHPNRKFIFVGDTGEQDPEIYASLASKYPKQVVKIVIRDASAQGNQQERCAKAFDGLLAEKWLLFRDAKELTALDTLFAPAQ